MSAANCQGWYRDVAGQIDKWGEDATKLSDYNVGGITRQKALVNSTAEYEFNVCPMPCNFTHIDRCNRPLALRGHVTSFL